MPLVMEAHQTRTVVCSGLAKVRCRGRTSFSRFAMEMTFIFAHRWHNARITTTNTGFYNMGMDLSLGMKTRRIKIFVSTPNNRSMLPSLYLLVAIDYYYTPYTFGFR
ncbi:unnamed protein product [Sphacelaria rigidula]